MQTVSSTYQALLAANAAKEVKAVIAGTTYEQDKLVSVKTSVALMQGLAVGNAVSAQLDLVIHTPGTIPRMAEIDLYVRLNDGTTQSEWLPKGVYFIDTREYDETADQLTVHAYDAMLKTEQSFTQAGSQGEWPRTDIAVVKEIAYRIGLSTSASATDGIDSRTLAIITNGYAVQYPGITLEDGTPQYSTDGAYSMREVLGYIGAMYGGNWCISDAGKLRLIAIKTPPEPAVLRFSSPSGFTLKTNNTQKNWDGTLYSSTDGETWTIWDGTTTLSSGADNTLYLRGTNNTVISGGSSCYWVFTGSDVSCTGNIESLLDYATVENGGHPTMADRCFEYLFYRCFALLSAPDLPATTLSEYCYYYMFAWCTGLTSAPELPATTLASSCYYNMFQWCTGLTSAPELPATTLAGSCYQSMFGWCRGLTAAPELPATTLASGCYASMFYGCTAITSPPELPATTLASSCYQSMFYECSALTGLPELPATTLAPSCYEYMFRYCTGIKLSATQAGEYQHEYRIPASGSGTSAANAMNGMFTNTGGTFKGTPSINTTYYLA